MRHSAKFSNDAIYSPYNQSSIIAYQQEDTEVQNDGHVKSLGTKIIFV